MELTVGHGRGYVTAEHNKPAQPIIGTIPVDSIYSPVLKVNYSVENTRVGNQVDYDKLTIEVWTDKTITARDAVSLGAKILCDHFTLSPTFRTPPAEPSRSRSASRSRRTRCWK